MKQLTLLFVMICSYGTMMSQKSSQINLHRADSIARSVKGRWIRHPQKLSDKLTASLTHDEEKVRAIYRWVAENITYSKKAYARPKKRTLNPYKVLRRRKAVCAGYSALFQSLCEFAEIECQYITGYARTDERHIGRHKRKSNHAWNLVKIDDQWHPIDVTWGSELDDYGKKRKLAKSNDAYFLPNEFAFYLDHYPEDTNHFRPDVLLSKKDYFRSPLPSRGTMKSSLTAYLPSEGIITQKPNEQIRFRFAFEDEIVDPRIMLVARSVKGRKKQIFKEVDVLRQEREWQMFDYTCPKKGNYYLDIYIGGKRFLTYRLIVR